MSDFCRDFSRLRFFLCGFFAPAFFAPFKVFDSCLFEFGISAIDEQNAVQVVVFVLNDARQKAVGIQRKGGALFVKCLNFYLFGAFDFFVYFRNRKAAFFIQARFLGRLDYLRIYK